MKYLPWLQKFGKHYRRGQTKLQVQGMSVGLWDRLVWWHRCGEGERRILAFSNISNTKAENTCLVWLPMYFYYLSIRVYSMAFWTTRYPVVNIHLPKTVTRSMMTKAIRTNVSQLQQKTQSELLFHLYSQYNKKTESSHLSYSSFRLDAA